MRRSSVWSPWIAVRSVISSVQARSAPSPRIYSRLTTPESAQDMPALPDVSVNEN